MFITLLLIIVVLTVVVILIRVGIQNSNNQKSSDETELIVCRDVAEIYCNTINFINELCAINSHVVQALEKFLSAISINSNIETYQLTSLESGIDFRLKEVNELSKIIPPFKLNITSESKLILAKHKLSEIEVNSTEMCVKQSVSEVLSNFQYLKDSIKGNQYDALAVNFALARLKSFEYESNAIFTEH